MSHDKSHGCRGHEDWSSDMMHWNMAGMYVKSRDKVRGKSRRRGRRGGEG